MPKNLHFQRIVFSITMFSLFILQTNCRSYYKIAKSPAAATPENVTRLKNTNRYFVLRSGSNAFYMTDLSLSADQKTLQCKLDSLPVAHRLHLKEGDKHHNFRYKKHTAEKFVLSEVHFYIPEDAAATAGTTYTLAIDKIEKMEVLQKDGGRTTGSYVLGTLGGVAAGLAVAGLIAALSSCPFVSAYDGKQFYLQGEIYGGAIYPQLARNDFMRLDIAPTSDGNLQLKISNELKEHQHTDLAELIVVKHDKGARILPDEQGNLYGITNEQQPLSATFANNKNVLGLLQHKDDNLLMEFNDSLSANGNNELVLKFSKPQNISKGKLVLSIKNAYWLDYLYGKMLQGFGSYYNSFVKKQYNKPADALYKWTREQQIPLQVSVKTTEGWKVVTNITTTGPVATREMVVSLNLSSVTKPFAEVKLSCGFMFWEVDYAAIDYTLDNNFTVETLSPASATDEAGKDVLNTLSKADGVYLEQPVPGTVTTVIYNYSKPKEGEEQTFILHSKGYYEHVRDFKGKPDVAFLQQFKKPGAFSKFSVAMFKKHAITNLETTAKK